MNQSKAFCPQCKNEVVFVTTGSASKCPVCGFQYQLSEPRLAAEPTAGSGVMGILAVLLRVVLIMILIAVAVVVTGLAVAFAGCALAAKGF